MMPPCLAENPFFVLGLSISASLVDVERTGQKLIAQLAIGAQSAQSYASPFGPQARDESKVRSAVAALRNPSERALWEFWAEGAAMREAAAEPPAWSEAQQAIHWSVECTDS